LSCIKSEIWAIGFGCRRPEQALICSCGPETQTTQQLIGDLGKSQTKNCYGIFHPRITNNQNKDQLLHGSTASTPYRIWWLRLADSGRWSVAAASRSLGRRWRFHSHCNHRRNYTPHILRCGEGRAGFRGEENMTRWGSMVSERAGTEGGFRRG
jgi:hypothetical protein